MSRFFRLRIIRFGIIGGLSTAIDFAILNVLVIFFSFNVYFAATISFILAVSNSFYWNKKWTFNGFLKNKSTSNLYLGYFLVNLVGLGLNTLILFTLIQGFSLWYNFAKIFAAIIVFFWNYFASKRWVFNPSSSGEALTDF